ncbi:LAQU0S04e04148g1_1 [Lachancea quebecensis]|uniref:LAQU0S04e04148g1_1 n=1 Tax=Lachancea quebecensis TaxID=1654605 RepID=A0A0N7MLC9_9SACH|nr:LAQU0S04e04148g1_1 [Lachancea quebecensis]
MVEVGDRLFIDGHTCSILYIGHIPQWNDSRAFGLEWDDCKRGKHSGSINGIEYFKTRAPHAGSFVKESKVMVAIQSRRSFVEAVSDNYLQGLETCRDVYFGIKKAELYGLNILASRNRDLESLRYMDLSAKLIAFAGENDDLLTLGSRLKNLAQLNLSSNLFRDFSEVLRVLNGIPHLRSLDISKNRLEVPSTAAAAEQVQSLEELRANFCQLSTHGMSNILSYFPNLKRLELSGNYANELDTIMFPASLNELSITENCLSTIPLSTLETNITYLNVSSNKIRNLPLGVFPNIKALDLSYCCIDQWNLIDEICDNFPNMRDLRINGNPLTINESDENVFLQLIGRNRNITCLNGSFLTEKVRSDAEIYLMSQVSSKKANINKSGSQWRHLLQKHGPVKRRVEPTGLSAIFEIVTLVLEFKGNKVRELSVLTSYSIRYLKTTISRALSIPASDINLYYALEGGTQQEFSFEFSPISMFNIKSGDKIFVDLKEA